MRFGSGLALRNRDLNSFLLTLAYDGTNYCGWQRQPGQPTLQAELERALAFVTQREATAVGSGRTDSGVHALAQAVSVAVETRLAPRELRKALNAQLPGDMAVLDVRRTVEGFHAVRDAVSKRYRYVLDDAPVRNVFRRAYCWKVYEPLDVERMHAAAQALRGTHDFRSFESQHPQRATSVRTVHEALVRRASGGAGQGGGPSTGAIHFEIAADGFLYNMVRAIAGTLVDVGRGAKPETWLADVVAAGDRQAAGMTAPPQGLFLVHVDYPPHVFLDAPDE